MANDVTNNRHWTIPLRGLRPWYDEQKALLNEIDADVQALVDAIPGNINGPQDFKGTTNNGSSYVIIARDSDGNIVEYIDTDGFHQLRYRDEYVGGQWVTPQGASAPDDVTVTIGGVPFRLKAFDGVSTEETQANTFECAHDVPWYLINAGTVNLEWHVHFLPSGNLAGDVQWHFDWCFLPLNSTTPASPITMTSATITKPIALNSQYKHYIASTTLAVPAGGFALGGQILFNLRRTPSGTGDTYGEDCLLLATSLHVPSDGNGSRQLYVR